ncbi:MAG: class I SAM-dependent methyltransferase [Pararhodobacter sp.]
MSLADPAPRALRLDLARDAGLDLPSEGAIALFHPGTAEVPHDLPRDRLRIVTPHAPEFTALSAQGYSCAIRPAGRYAATLVCLPRAKDEARDLIAKAARLTDGPVIVDGQRHDGIDAMLRALRERVTLSEVIAKGHGKIAWFVGGAEALGDWIAAPMSVAAPGKTAFSTIAGLFSADGIDPASALLAEALPAGLKGVAADLGAGWGYLSRSLLDKAPDLAALHLIEADARALECARRNVTDPRAQFHWADATAPLKGLLLDVVIMNPPFHQGRAATPQLGAAFIAAAARMLKPTGQLWMVANRHLPYEPALAAAFKTHSEVAGTAGFKILAAEGPVRASARAGAPTRARPRRRTGHRA